MSDLIITPNMELLARDIAVLTANQLYTKEEIAAGYSLTKEMVESLEEEPKFQERIAYHKNQIGNDRNSLLRAQAKLMADAQLRDLHEIATDPNSRPADKLKAISMIVELADVKPKQEQSFSGMVLNVSFGSGMPGIAVVPDKGVIEHE